jgi:predicted RecA/RadA family phage recombinase
MSTTLEHLDDSTMLFTATTTTKSSGDVVVMTDMIGIAKVDFAAAGTGAVYIRGVHNLSKNTGVPFAVGDSAYWDVTDGEFNLVATNNFYGGKVYSASTTAQATCQLILNLGNAGPR